MQTFAFLSALTGGLLGLNVLGFVTDRSLPLYCAVLRSCTAVCTAFHTIFIPEATSSIASC